MFRRHLLKHITRNSTESFFIRKPKSSVAATTAFEQNTFFFFFVLNYWLYSYSLFCNHHSFLKFCSEVLLLICKFGVLYSDSMWEKTTDKETELPSLDIKRSFLREEHTEKCNGALCFRSPNYNTSSASVYNLGGMQRFCLCMQRLTLLW